MTPRHGPAPDRGGTPANESVRDPQDARTQALDETPDETLELGPPSGMASRTFESLSNRDFRWYMTAMVGHFSALQMQQTARGFLVFDLTESFAALGTMALANAAPRLVLGLIGGVIADRASRRRMVQLGQLVGLALALVIGTLIATDLLRWEHLLVAAFVQGTVNALTQPSRQSLIPEIVGIERLTNAISLNTAGRNVTRLVAPGLAGLLLAWVGAEFVYFLMAGFYMAAVLALLKVPARPGYAAARSDRESRSRAGDAIADLVAGARYIGAHRIIRMLLAVHVAFVLFSQRMLPGFVSEVLGGGPEQFGLLLSLGGIGALGGSLMTASMRPHRRGRVVLLSAMAMGVGLLAFSFSTSFWITATIMIVLNAAQAARQALSSVLVHTYVDDEYRGRVSSVLAMEMGLVSFGAFGVGILAATFGVQLALAGTALGLIGGAVSVAVLVPGYRALD